MRHRTLSLKYTGHFIVIIKFRSGSMTNIECHDELMLAIYHVGRDWQGGKYVI
jgi:hypothetical protein